MLKIILQAVDPLLMSDAESYFHESYIEGLRSKSTYRASIVARYFISRLVYDLFNVKDFLPCVDSAGKPIFDSLIYWSIAHTGDTVFVGVSDGAIGVDIEEIKTRDTSVW